MKLGFQSLIPPRYTCVEGQKSEKSGGKQAAKQLELLYLSPSFVKRHKAVC